MLYQLSHYIKDKLPFIWNLVEFTNEKLFLVRYRKRLKGVPDYLEQYQGTYQIKEATLGDIQPLVAFFAKQPEEAYTYFRPHEFDEKTLKHLVKNRSHLMFLVYDEKELIGYYFLRCFFMGKGFLGKMVDHNHQGKGIGKLMCQSAMDVATNLHLRMFETISKDNISSLYSTQKVLDTRLVEELDNNYIYIEDFPKGTLKKY